MHIRYICTQSGTHYPYEQPRWQGENEALLDLDFTPSFDPEAVTFREKNMWRYREALPLPAEVQPVSFGEGFTPLNEVSLGGRKALVKTDFLFPSGSYKDRGAALLMSYARWLGVRSVVQDSSGNAGCAVACYSAAAGIDCTIFVPADTSPGKLAQIRMYGADLQLVPGSREDTAQATMQAAAQTFYASHVWNPVFFHGTKTFAYEICEQLSWEAPDSVVLPAGNGTLILGAYIGFAELKAAGITDRMPRIIGVQAANCAPLAAAWQAGHQEISIQSWPETLAEGIAIAAPARAAQMLAYIRQTNGLLLTVEEPQIKEALWEMCRKGYYIEPTSAAVMAGLQQYLTHHALPEERVVSLLTGNGLKSTEKMLKLLGQKG